MCYNLIFVVSRRTILNAYEVMFEYNIGMRPKRVRKQIVDKKARNK